MFGTRSRFVSRSQQRSRRGLTLVEMLVAMALTLMIVFAIVQMFQYVGERTTNSRAVLELAGQVRAASNLLQQDLSMHTAQAQPWNTRNDGYLEFTEGGSNDKTQATSQSINGDIDDAIAFTAESKEIPFTGQFNGGTYTSHLAEIIWWVGIDANGDTNLYRRVLLIRPDLPVNSVGGDLKTFYNMNDVSVRRSGTTLIANTLVDLSNRKNRFAHDGDDGGGGNGPYPLNKNKLNARYRDGDMIGTDVVLSKVSAFDMRVYDPRAIVYEKTVSGVKTLLTPTDPGYVSSEAFAATTATSGSSTIPSGAPGTKVAQDDGSLTGTWTNVGTPAVPGYQTDVNHTPAGNNSTATWTFSGLSPGKYKVYATWNAAANRSTQAPYTIYDNTSPLGTVTVSQQVAGSDVTYGGVGWRKLGADVTISSSTLKVTLNAVTGESSASYVVADGVMIEDIPMITVTNNGVNWGEGTFVDMGYDPSFVRYQSNFILNGGSTTTTPGPNPVLIDNGGSGYSESGTWAAGNAGVGYGGSCKNAAAGAGTAVATYSFNSLPAGRYRLHATWVAAANRSSSTPFKVKDGSTLLGAVSVNQQAAPVGTISGLSGTWDQIGGLYVVTSGSLVATIENNSGGFANADAMRVSWDSALPSTAVALTGSSNYCVPLSQFSPASSPKSGLSSNPTWDTWPATFEANGVNDNFDASTDSVIDNVAGSSTTSVSSQGTIYETNPPYAVPLRGISVTIRAYEPHSRQLLQRSVVENFATE